MLSSAGWSGGCNMGSWWDHTHTGIIEISDGPTRCKTLTCTVEEFGQFKSFKQNSSNSSLSSSLEKILSISWNDVDSSQKHQSILFKELFSALNSWIQCSQTCGRQIYWNLLINLIWYLETLLRMTRYVILKVSTFNVNIAKKQTQAESFIDIKSLRATLKI